VSRGEDINFGEKAPPGGQKLAAEKGSVSGCRYHVEAHAVEQTGITCF